MKKLSVSRRVDFALVVMHREDLQELVKLLTEMVKDLRIRDEKYEYDSIDELFQSQKGILAEMHLVSREMGFDLSFTRYEGISLCCRVNNPEEESLFLRTREFLSERERRISHILDPRIGSAVFVLVLVATPFVAPSLDRGVLLSIMSALLFGVVIYVTPLKGILFNSVSAVSRNEKNQFWSQNKDKITLAFISALIGAIVSWLFAKL